MTYCMYNFDLGKLFSQCCLPTTDRLDPVRLLLVIVYVYLVVFANTFQIQTKYQIQIPFCDILFKYKHPQFLYSNTYLDPTLPDMAAFLWSGYVQGMSDLLAPILVVMENEVDAFWCFAGFMELLVSGSQ